MLTRKCLLVACTLLSAVLFIDGASLLAFMNKSVKEKIYIKQELGQEPNKAENPSEQMSVIEERPVNLLVLGVDEEGVRTDVIAVLNFNAAQGKLNILSIARDTKVRVKGKTSKINALVAIGGERLLIEEVEKLTGLPINYYILLNFKGFRKIVDILGGVEVYVPFNMNYDDPEQNLHIHLKEGRQLLDGKKAEQFVRYRKGNRMGQGYSDGDIGRIKAQQEFMKALLEQKVKFKYISKAGEIFYTLKKYVKTNIEIGDVNYYLNSLKTIKYDEIKAYTIPGEAAYINNIWYFICDEKKTRDLIETHFFR
ncbi:MAG: LCP family protein [Clostridiales bacterium]|jgi:LCP family protein required for cell wall assembly|nr:LCP family protein [Eubacteriales bacterium]MDH7567145.1 LCP family protein [Clostridiales bacterium]